MMRLSLSSVLTLVLVGDLSEMMFSKGGSEMAMASRCADADARCR